MPANKRKAFTLIELLVVIAIISILASILFPVFARARENARRASCSSNQKNLALAIFQYAQDYDERVPAHWISGSGLTNQWVYVVQPYVKNFQIFFCPSSNKNSGAEPTASNISYGYNYRGLTELVPGGAAYERMGVSLAAFNRPAETIMLGDTGLNATNNYVLDPATTDRLPSDIHLEGCNFTFVDGHVKWLKSRPVVAAYNTANSMWDRD